MTPRARARVTSGILATALVLGLNRFLALGEWSLWIDEAFTLADARHGAGTLNPLGYFLFGWLYELVQGQPSELHLRLPAAVFGWLCIPLTFLSFGRLVGKRAASVAALFLALSPWHLYWSQNARFYTLTQVLCLGGLWALTMGLRRGALGRLIVGLLLMVAAAGTQPSALLFIGGTILAVYAARERELEWGAGQGRTTRRRRNAWRLLAVACLAVPLVGSYWTIEVFDMWNTRQGSGSLMHLIKSAGFFFSPALALGAAWGAWQLVRSRDRKGRLVLVLVCVGMGTAAIATAFMRVSAQYTFVLFPVFCALAAVPLGTPAPWRGRTWGLLCLLVAPLVVEDVLYFTTRHGDRPRWEEAYAHVFERRSEEDLVLAMESPVGQYYWNPLSDDLRDQSSFVYLDSFSAHVALDWSRFERPMWIILNREQLWDWNGEDREALSSFLDQRCALDASFLVPLTPRDLDVFVYRFQPGL